jgi:hypothetical protein
MNRRDEACSNIIKFLFLIHVEKYCIYRHGEKYNRQRGHRCPDKR